MSTIAILWLVKAIFEKRAATVEVDTLISPVEVVAMAISRFAHLSSDVVSTYSDGHTTIRRR